MQKYDAIVVGSGAAGGMAAKTLTEGGAHVLLLEAGPDPTAMASPVLEARAERSSVEALVEKAQTASLLLREGADRVGRFVRGAPDVDGLGHLQSAGTARETFRPERQGVQKNCRGYGPGTKMLYVDDVDQPYTAPAHAPFVWIRGRQLGGRTQTWKRVTPRLTDSELSAPNRDGHGHAWPLTYEDLRPHYEEAERALRVIGAVEAGAEPHGGALPQRDLAPAEAAFREAAGAKWPERRVVLCPFASPLGPEEAPETLDDRIIAQTRGESPTYDCSVRHSIDFARRTGRLEVRTNAAVRHVITEGDRAVGVAYVDTQKADLMEARAKFVVLCASTLESTRIMLLSGDGFANASGALGRYLTDHLFGVGVAGVSDVPYQPKGFPELFVHPFRNTDRDQESHDFIRSYQLYGEISALRAGPARRWVNSLTLSAQGEVLPHAHNRVTIDPEVVDRWDVPSLLVRYERGDNELKMAADMVRTAEEMVKAAGYEILMSSENAVASRLERARAGHGSNGIRPKRERARPLLSSLGCPESVCHRRRCVPHGGESKSHDHHHGAYAASLSSPALATLISRPACVDSSWAFPSPSPSFSGRSLLPTPSNRRTPRRHNTASASVRLLGSAVPATSTTASCRRNA